MKVRDEQVLPWWMAQMSSGLNLYQSLGTGAGKKISIYMDSRCAFATAQVHGSIYQQRDLLTS